MGRSKKSREVMGDRDTLPPALRAACVLSSVYAALRAMTCVLPALNAGLSAMRHAALRSMSVDARGGEERVSHRVHEGLLPGING
jgi:hypothetical protein